MAGKTVVLDGDCQLIIPSAGELGVVTAIRKPYPTYTGETTVTPSDETQVLHTELQTLINDITVEAVPGDYVGSDIPRRDSSDVAASGATVTAPAGYYEAEATKTIQSGTEGTPTATKGAVSNHAVSVTPSVTNTEGYISGGTKSGTAVTVSASELVSGTKEITENGSGIDVANYASVDVAVPSSDPNLQSKTNINPTTSSQTIEADPGYDGLSSVQINAMPNGTEGTPTAAKSAVSNHSVSVTPSVTNTAGYISGGTKTGTPVTVTAAELESGAKAITANGNGQDVTGYAAVDVSVPNSYTASDEGKVVNNSALVAQTSATYTNNGTYDTTLKNSVTVDVPSQAPVINPLSVTANGTYSAPAGVDGYSPVTVNVSGGGGISMDNVVMRSLGSTIYASNATFVGSYAFFSNSTITSVNLTAATTIHENAFAYCKNLKSINAPNVTKLESYVFSDCYSLNQVIMPNLTQIGSYAFVRCSRITSISAPAVTSINYAAFGGCSSLTAIDFPNATLVGVGAFSGCEELKSVSLPALESVYGSVFSGCRRLADVYLPMAKATNINAFAGCTSLVSISLSNLTSLGTNTFYNCQRLKDVSFPAVQNVEQQCFNACSSLQTISLPNVNKIGSSAFRSCVRLTELHLEEVTSVPTLYPYAFSSTPIGGYSATAGQDGSIFVPASLYASFQAANNWSSVASRMVSV